jgi:hypothetical protein
MPTAMAHHCPERTLLGDEREDTIQDQTMRKLFESIGVE